jgi:hypothetical protein
MAGDDYWRGLTRKAYSSSGRLRLTQKGMNSEVSYSRLPSAQWRHDQKANDRA